MAAPTQELLEAQRGEQAYTRQLTQEIAALHKESVLPKRTKPVEKIAAATEHNLVFCLSCGIDCVRQENLRYRCSSKRTANTIIHR